MPSKKKAFVFSLKHTYPMLISWIPVALAYGLMMRNAGYNSLWTLLSGVAIPFGSLGMVAVSIGFSVFISASQRYPLIYGSIASLILLMFWLYVSSLVVYCGAALNIVLRDMKADTEEEKKLSE